MQQLKKISALAALMHVGFFPLHATVEAYKPGGYASFFLTTSSGGVDVNAGENLIFNNQIALSGIGYDNTTGIFTLNRGTYAVTYFFAPFAIPSVNMYVNDQLVLNSPLGGNSTVLSLTEPVNSLSLQYISSDSFAAPPANQSWASISLSQTLPASIPTNYLSGNNLAFSDYINEFALGSTFYFIPSEVDGALNAALQSASPTRNALSIYTASNNLFDLTTSFANHIRIGQSDNLWRQKNGQASGTVCEVDQDQSLDRKNAKKHAAMCPSHNDSIWFEMIGSLAYQKSQHQTVGFNPTTGGLILAYDRKITPQVRLGAGLSYLYTHIHEKQGQGHSNINQEEGFVYSSWDNQKFYVDLLLMVGGVQIDQVRNTIMSGFSFQSSSHPRGWQLLPHLEFGYKKNFTTIFDFNPFVMLDWANAWQGSYKEKGNNPFNIGQNSYYGSLLRTEAGFRFYETLHFDSWNFSLQEKLSYANTQSFNAGKVKAFLIGAPGSFTVETLSSMQNLAVVQLAMSFNPLKAAIPTSTLFYQGEFSSQYQSHQLNIEFSWQF